MTNTGSSLAPRSLPFAACLLGGVLLGLDLSRAQDPPIDGERVAAVRAALDRAFIPVESVDYAGGRYRILFRSDASDGQRNEAQVICDALCQEVDSGVSVGTLEDALVVLRYEPFNQSARELVRARYEALKRQARTTRGEQPR